jgi:Tol biopolymer transport system component
MNRSTQIVRFGIFEANLQTGELRKSGAKVRLQGQPFQVLAILLEHPGELISREEMRRRVWPQDTFVDFEHALSTAITKIRVALGDDADNPRFVETLPRRGYRFIGPVDKPGSQSAQKHHFAKLKGGRNLVAAGAAVLFLLSTIAVWRLTRQPPDSPLPSIEVAPLVSMPGYEIGPAFSPDGNQVVFREFDGPLNSGIYTAVVGGEKSLRLTSNPNDCCATWSPDARQVAFVRLVEKEVVIYVIPALGGTERRLYTGPRPLYPSLAWSPNGKILALPDSSPNSAHSWISFLSLSDGTMRRLTNPPDDSRDNAAAFSPDGSKVAFIRGTIAGVVNDLFVVPTTGGQATRLTFDNRPVSGITWTPDGNDIVFSSARGGQNSLWRVSASGGNPRPVAGANAEASSPSVARRGNLLAYQQVVGKDNICRITLTDEKHSPSSRFVLISAKGSKLRPHFSADGKRIAFESDRLGNAEIWTCDSDGADCAQLTSLHGTAGTMGWSQDGRHIAFEFHPGEHSEIYVVDVPGGVPHLVPTRPGADNLTPSWSRDGKWIYFTSKQGDGPFQLWKVPSKGGAPVQITRTGGLSAVESTDGRWLYYSKYESGGVWRMPLDGGQESRVLDQPSGRSWYNWALAKNGIYFLNTRSSNTTIDFFEFANHRITHIYTLNKPTGWGLAVAPDGNSIIYVEAEFEESNIMLVKNFR